MKPDKIPENFIDIRKFIALVIVISLIASFILIGIFIRQKQDESFKIFIQAEKAGTYQGVKMSPLVDLKTYKHDGTWIVEIGDNSLLKSKVKKSAK